MMKQERSEEFDLVPAKVVRIVHLKNGHDLVRYPQYLFDQIPARPSISCVDDLL